MVNPFNRENESCERFLDVLESVSVHEELRRCVEQLRAELPEPEALHLERCLECQQALEDLVETRNALEGYETPVPDPWFKARVMAAIAAQEREEEAKDGVWISVRRLAPRMVAVSALLLVLGGSWAVQQRSRELASGANGDIVFDASGSPTLYDDAPVNGPEVRP